MHLNSKILTGKTTDNLLEFHNSGIFLHQQVIKPFEKLQKDALDAIGADIQIVSGYRSYERQLIIWNEKAQGKRKLLDKNNQEIIFSKLSPQQIVDSILNWSAIPGCSRHHWGTDIDIYDANVCEKDLVRLTSQECETGGPFNKLHQWLDNYLDNSEFFRPFSTDKGGVGVEKWHLSYAPIAQQCYEHYTEELFESHIQESEIIHKEVLLQAPAFYYQTYFKQIDLP